MAQIELVADDRGECSCDGHCRRQQRPRLWVGVQTAQLCQVANASPARQQMLSRHLQSNTQCIVKHPGSRSDRTHLVE